MVTGVTDNQVVQGSNADIVAEFTSVSSGTLTAVDGTPTITITDPQGADSVSSANMSQETVGRWVYNFDTSGELRGWYVATVTADVDTGGTTRNEVQRFKFRVI